jgi:hypothetical protein
LPQVFAAVLKIFQQVPDLLKKVIYNLVQTLSIYILEQIRFFNLRCLSKKQPEAYRLRAIKRFSGSVLLSHTASRAVPSALKSLTSVFEMGTGVTSSLLPPKNGYLIYSFSVLLMLS